MAGDAREGREETTDLLASWLAGDPGAGDRLFAALYGELRPLARRQLRRTPRGGTLDTTALVHEAYLKLIEGTRTALRDRGHFLALVSRVMRQIVVDHARRRGAVKRGADLLRPLADREVAAIGQSADDLVALDLALGRLEEVEPRLARLVDLRFFGGLSIEEAAEALAISLATAKRDWLKARAFLLRHMGAPRRG